MITGLLTWGGFLLSLANSVAKNKEDKEDLATAANALGWVGSVAAKTRTGSIQESANRTLISPMVLFEESLMHLEYMPDLMAIINMRDIRDALSHLALEGTVGSMKISHLVDQINPNRAAGFNALRGCEAFDPDVESVLNVLKGKEDTKDQKSAKEFFSNSNGKKNNKDDEGKKTTSNTLVTDPNDIRNLTEYVPLALGRTVRATTIIDGKEVGFYLTFRQIPIPASTRDMELMFRAVKKGENWSARLKEYASGGITRPELLKGTDVIKQEFNIRNNELSGYYRESMQRGSNNVRAALRTGMISMNTHANTIIISKDTADRIELDIGMRFDSPKIKTIRKYLSANTIVIVDDSRGIFKFYTVGDPVPVKYTLQQIRTKSKKEDTGSLESLIKLLSGR